MSDFLFVDGPKDGEFISVRSDMCSSWSLVYDGNPYIRTDLCVGNRTLCFYRLGRLGPQGAFRKIYEAYAQGPVPTNSALCIGGPVDSEVVELPGGAETLRARIPTNLHATPCRSFESVVNSLNTVQTVEYSKQFVVFNGIRFLFFILNDITLEQSINLMLHKYPFSQGVEHVQS